MTKNQTANSSSSSFPNFRTTKTQTSRVATAAAVDALRCNNSHKVGKAHCLLNSRAFHFGSLRTTPGWYLLRQVWGNGLHYKLDFGPSCVIKVAVNLDTMLMAVFIFTAEDCIRRKNANLPTSVKTEIEVLQLHGGHVAMANSLEKLLAQMHRVHTESKKSSK